MRFWFWVIAVVLVALFILAKLGVTGRDFFPPPTTDPGIDVTQTVEIPAS